MTGAERLAEIRGHLEAALELSGYLAATRPLSDALGDLIEELEFLEALAAAEDKTAGPGRS